MKIALTGASGHIGFNLCKNLIEYGHEVTILKRLPAPHLSALDISVITGDLMNTESLDLLTKEKEIVIHLAAAISINSKKDAVILEQTNILGTSNVVKSCVRNRIKKLIHFSSVDAFDSNPTDQKLDENRELKSDEGAITYGLTKAISHRIALECKQHGIEVVVLCPTAVIGPEDHSPSLSGKMILKYAQRQIPVLIRGGFNWVDVRDVVNSTINTISDGVNGETYLLPGHFATHKQIAQLVYEETGSAPPKFTVPFWVAKIGAPFVALKAKMTKSDPLFTRESIELIEKANKEVSGDKALQYLKHTPRPLEDTIKDTIHWFRQTGPLLV